MRHVRVPAFTTASALDLISPQSIPHMISLGTIDYRRNRNIKLQTSNPPIDGLTYSLPLLSASRLNPSMSLASLRLHSPCPVAAATQTGRGEANIAASAAFNSS